MQIIFFGQVLGFEPARKEGETLGYLKCFDREGKTNFDIGCKFMVDENSVPVTPERFILDGVVIRNGKNGTFMTCTNLQVYPAAGERPARQRQAENGA